MCVELCVYVFTAGSSIQLSLIRSRHQHHILHLATPLLFCSTQTSISRASHTSCDLLYLIWTNQTTRSWTLSLSSPRALQTSRTTYQIWRGDQSSCSANLRRRRSKLGRAIADFLASSDSEEIDSEDEVGGMLDDVVVVPSKVHWREPT